MNVIRVLYRLFFTGVLYLLSVIGYLFYGYMIMLRLLQWSVALVFLAVFVAAGLSAYYFFAPMSQSSEEVVLVVKQGGSVRSITRELEEKGVVRSARVLQLVLRVRNQDRGLYAGSYSFYRGENAWRAAERLRHAKPIELSVTIPEGLTIEQTAARFARHVSIDTSAFIALCSDTVFIRSLGLAGTSLEGYLFPETYRFSPEVVSQEIIKKMAMRFIREYDALPQTPVAAAMGRHAIVTLASIVEKEATMAEERSRIAAVFHNRLRLKMPLGADPTVRYILRKFDGPLRVSELNNPSPYNTRKHAGLPPGPICSPGRASLLATVSPLDTRDLYFVARWDGSGAHDFSFTLAEHNRKKNDIRKQNENRIRYQTREAR